ncbi:hypothetical protein OSTOST_04039 [Ostertagia ostertagi]
MAYRSTPCPSAPDQRSPAEAFLGRRLRTDLELLLPQEDVTNDHETSRWKCNSIVNMEPTPKLERNDTILRQGLQRTKTVLDTWCYRSTCWKRNLHRALWKSAMDSTRESAATQKRHNCDDNDKRTSGRVRSTTLRYEERLHAADDSDQSTTTIATQSTTATPTPAGPPKVPIRYNLEGESQYEDPKRITIQMIRQLKSMKACHDDPRTLRNNLSDVQAIITPYKNKENIQEEIARKEFDKWYRVDYEAIFIDNLTNIVKRKEHLESRNENLREQHSLFHTRTSEPLQLQCIGCGRPHKFDTCYKFQTIQQKINHLKTLNVCWKCFDTQHRTIFCNKPNCTHCGGPHNPIICLRKTSAINRSSRPTYKIQQTFRIQNSNFQ